jgi:hypothetical protein
VEVDLIKALVHRENFVIEMGTMGFVEANDHVSQIIQLKLVPQTTVRTGKLLPGPDEDPLRLRLDHRTHLLSIAIFTYKTSTNP